MIVLQGTANIAGPGGRRSVAIEDFNTGPGRNVLQEGEFVVSLHFPAPAPNSGAAWERFIPRNEMDIAVTNAGVYVRFEGDNVADARVCIGAVAPTALFVKEAADAIIGKPLTEETITACGEAAKAAARPDRRHARLDQAAQAPFFRPGTAHAAQSGRTSARELE